MIEKDEIQEILKRCAYICEKKNRQCKLLASRDRNYCGEHFTYSEENKKVFDLKILLLNLIQTIFFRKQTKMKSVYNVHWIQNIVF